MRAGRQDVFRRSASRMMRPLVPPPTGLASSSPPPNARASPRPSWTTNASLSVTSSSARNTSASSSPAPTRSSPTNSWPPPSTPASNPSSPNLSSPGLIGAAHDLKPHEHLHAAASRTLAVRVHVRTRAVRVFPSQGARQIRSIGDFFQSAGHLRDSSPVRFRLLCHQSTTLPSSAS